MSEYPDERADECEHLNVEEEAGSLLCCRDCGETRQSVLWHRETISEEEDRDIARQLDGRWDK